LEELPRLGEFIFTTSGKTPVSGFSSKGQRAKELPKRIASAHGLADYELDGGHPEQLRFEHRSAEQVYAAFLNSK
jgi:hypothetical protein